MNMTVRRSPASSISPISPRTGLVIGVGNMLPSWVRVVCVDINPNPAVVTKLVDQSRFRFERSD
jgi:hypothetical protein